MPYYNTCPICGSNLDPCETCDCEKERTDEHHRLKKGNSQTRKAKKKRVTAQVSH